MEAALAHTIPDKTEAAYLRETPLFFHWRKLAALFAPTARSLLP